MRYFITGPDMESIDNIVKKAEIEVYYQSKYVPLLIINSDKELEQIQQEYSNCIVEADYKVNK